MNEFTEKRLEGAFKNSHLPYLRLQRIHPVIIKTSGCKDKCIFFSEFLDAKTPKVFIES